MTRLEYNWEDDAKGCYLEALRHKRAGWLVQNAPGVQLYGFGKGKSLVDFNPSDMLYTRRHA